MENGTIATDERSKLVDSKYRSKKVRDRIERERRQVMRETAGRRRKKGRRMLLKGIVAGAACMVLIGTASLVVFRLQSSAGDSEVKAKETQYVQTAGTVEKKSTKTEQKVDYPVETDVSGDWNLVLVNKNFLIPEDYEVELKDIGSGHKIDARAYEDYTQMIADAKKEKIYIYVLSSYRTQEKQEQLFANKIQRLMAQGMTEDEARLEAATVVTLPGASEHQLGLAVDLVDSRYQKLDEKQENTKGFQWLKKHCAEYGFILRYPTSKTSITGIIYEPWHFRYVGKEAAKEIMERGITLEEYLGKVVEDDGSVAEAVLNYPLPEKKKTTKPKQTTTVQPETVVDGTEGTETPSTESTPSSGSTPEVTPPAAQTPQTPETTPPADQTPQTPEVVPPVETTPETPGVTPPVTTPPAETNPVTPPAETTPETPVTPEPEPTPPAEQMPETPSAEPEQPTAPVV